MVITEAYIENFGILHGYRYSPDKGLNQIYGSNGTGKSTFAAFVRAMLYGMPHTRNRKSLDDADRKKFKPWQGGIFGGYIVFEVGDKRYRLERTFGDKEREDTFKLTDADTGLVTSDYTKNIGVEIFGVDRDGYTATAWIFGRNMQVDVNDSMHAKLGNTLELENDCANFDKAISKITEAIREFTRTGSRGLLHELKSKLTATTHTIHDIQRKIEAVNNDLEERFLQNKSLNKSIALPKSEDVWIRRLAWLDDYFSNGVPDEDELIADIEVQNAVCENINKKRSIWRMITGAELAASVISFIAGFTSIFMISDRIIFFVLIALTIVLLGAFCGGRKYLRNLEKKLVEGDMKLSERKKEKELRDEYLNLTQLEEQRTAMEKQLLEQKNSLEIERYEKELDELNKELREAVENRERLEEELRVAAHKYEVLSKTKEYLVLSRESYVSSYMDTILVGIKKYLDIFDKKLGERVKIDAYMNISMQVGAFNKDISYFSSGIKDIIWVCERFAMIDALYKDEQPPVILDDPFVNLDDDMCVKAKKMLLQIAKDKQLVYMTCKSDRRLPK